MSGPIGPTGWQDGVAIFGLTKNELQLAINNGDVINLSVLGGLGTHSVKLAAVPYAGYTPPQGAVAFVAEFQDADTDPQVRQHYRTGRVFGVVVEVPLDPPGPFAGSLKGGINPAP